jgi:hypothetical protein
MDHDDVVDTWKQEYDAGVHDKLTRGDKKVAGLGYPSDQSAALAETWHYWCAGAVPLDPSTYALNVAGVRKDPRAAHRRLRPRASSFTPTSPRCCKRSSQPQGR